MWPAEQLAARRALIDATPVLRRLRERLTGLLATLLDRPLYVPERKALLSRDGGVCPDDGARLAFDPLAPHAHGCPRCGRVFERERDHLVWVWRYQIWLSERALHLALLAALGGSPTLADRAAEILGAYAARYRGYPNRDNVLGPTRLFFSTYLESIWLTQITIAAALLRVLGCRVPPEVEAMVEESAALIASFDEGFSNRQVWNDVALYAAGSLLGQPDLRAAALDGPHGVRAQLSAAVTSDGLWFEGENYHFFALRGLHLAGTMCGEGEADPLSGQREVLARMFVAPLDTLLPNLTIPARGDAPFGVSVRQVRFAELWEVGRAYGAGARAEAVLAAIYADDAETVPDQGLFELSEQEVNRVPGRVDRWGLGWKALLWMPPDRPCPGRWDAGTCLLPEAGVTVFRPSHGRYVALECGGRPGGHGHPDLLHLTLFSDELLLADLGTGSYVDQTLHWYRSTLAHNAPMPAGLNQQVRVGYPVAFQRAGDWSWVQATGESFAGPDTWARRSLVCGPEWVIDVVDVDVPEGLTVELPIHPLVGMSHLPSDGRLPLGRGEAIAAHLVPRAGEAIDVHEAPGPPDLWLGPGEPLAFVVRRAPGPGRWTQAYDLIGGAITAVVVDGDEIRVQDARGAITVVGVQEGQATITRAGTASIVLTGPVTRGARVASVSRRSTARRVSCPILTRRPEPGSWEGQIPEDAVSVLSARAYRRSEREYDARFHARVATFARGTRLGFAASVYKPDVCFRTEAAPDPRLDNETSDIHSDGLQCYAMVDAWCGWLAVPVVGSTRVRVAPVDALGRSDTRVDAQWCPLENGYAIVVEIDTGRRIRTGDEYSVNVVVNEMYPGRTRRAGQLALAGGGGWVYLRGDREHPDSAAVAEVV
ncbi:MAG: hypothetical protein AMS20_14315 [Gemmatimonas sp. SG8_28]|nr:MAG: hypothetical protein AMS20_14315 [Gemmatimonas sp. SG8_28]